MKMVALPDEKGEEEAKTKGFVDVFDHLLRKLLKAVYRDPGFRALESVWRGLELLYNTSHGADNVKIGLAHVSRSTLEEDLKALMLHLPVDLPSLIIIDIPFDSSPRSTALLEQVADLASSLLVPVVTWVEPKFFNLRAWDEVDKLPFLTHYLEEPHFGKWRSLCKNPASQWVSVTCDRFLARFPYGPGNPGGPVTFDEDLYLWVSPVWAVGGLIAKSQKEFGWPTKFTHWQKIFLPDLAVHQINSTTSIPLEVSFAEDRLRQFVKAGLMPLACAVNKDTVFCPFDRTLHGGSLSYQLFLSKITQLLLWCKDNFPSGLEAEQIQQGIINVFSSFWEKTGYQISDRLNVSVYKPDAESQGQVTLTIDPPKELLSVGDKVVLELPW